MPDQYTLSELHRRELAPTDRPPVMAEIDLISSHHPWAPLPRMVPWDEVGDGSVFDGMPEQGQTSEEVFSDPEEVKRAYGESVEYTLAGADLVPHHLPRPGPGAGRARRPPAAQLRERRRTPATTYRSA